MKNIIVYIIAVVVLVTSCGGNGAPVAKNTTDLQDMNLHGKVKQMNEYREDSRGRITFKQYTEFNEQGNITESGKVIDIYKFKKQPAEIRKYDSDGKLAEMINCKMSDMDYTRYLYDDLGRVVEEQHYHSSDYNSDKDMFSKKFEMDRSSKTEYASKGNKVEEYYKGELRHIYIYNGHGNITTDELYRDGRLYHIADFDYEYDKNGNITKLTEYVPYDPKSEAKYNERRGKRRTEEITAYDGKGRKVSKGMYRYEIFDNRVNKRTMFEETYTYDQYGNRTDSNTSYEYDHVGNWVKYTMGSGEPYIREFEYY